MWTNVKAIRVKTADNAMMTSMDTHANAPTATLAVNAKVTHFAVLFVGKSEIKC